MDNVRVMDGYVSRFKRDIDNLGFVDMDWIDFEFEHVGDVVAFIHVLQI